MYGNEKIGDPPVVGILLVNLGTPEAPTPRALREFLRELLTDPRVIELPRWKWWPILNLFILPFRSRHSAMLYRKIWKEEGSPLLTQSLQLSEALADALGETVASPVHVAVGMRYGSPSIRRGLRELRDRGCSRLLVFPMFPQYSGTTVGSVFDAVAAELTTWRVVPDLRSVHGYNDEPAYIETIAASIRELWASGGEPEKLLFSFHGIPLSYVNAGDPYQRECQETARLVAQALNLSEERYEVSFQSIFGKQEWVEPATDATVRGLARAGIKKLDVICPGFSIDCVETLEEIDQRNRGFYLDNGGADFRYIACLNDGPEHVRMLSTLVRRNLEGWVAKAGDHNAGTRGLRPGRAHIRPAGE